MPVFWRVFFFYHKWILNFLKTFLCICWDDHTVFIFQFVNTAYNIDWFTYTEKSFHSWAKSHLILLYNPFNALLDSVCWNFVKDVCIYVHQWYWPVILFFGGIFVLFGIMGDDGLIEWVWEFSFLCNFLDEFKQDRWSLFSKLLVEFTCEAIWP